MSDEYTVEQEITLLEQDNALLKETLTDLAQQLVSISPDAKQALQQQMHHVKTELQEVQQRLSQLKTDPHAVESTTIVPATLYNVPALPTPLIIPSELLNELKAKLVVKPSIAEVSAGQKNPIVLQASSGTGKSVLAAILAHEMMVRRAFTSGIFWISMGQQVNLLTQQLTLIKTLEDTQIRLTNTDDGLQYLRELCKNRACLLVLDDVWDIRDVLAFDALGRHCQLLITTCDPNLLDFIKHFVSGTQHHILSPFTAKQATEFLTHCHNVTALSTEQEEVATICHRLPAALKLLTSALHTQPSSNWRILLNQLSAVDSQDLPEATYPTVLLRALHLNVTALGDESEYYLTLAVFADYTHIPLAAIATLWGYLYHVQPEQTIEFLKELSARGLLSLNNNAVSLQVFQHDYVCHHAELDKLHTHLLTAYRRRCQPHGWASSPNDGYFFENLCWHLHSTERHKELKSLLLDFDWLATKLRVSTLHSLLDDYEFLADQDLSLMKQALAQIAADSLTDKQQLATQLLNALWIKPSVEIQQLLNQAKEVAPDWHPPTTTLR